jgi:hypothetical protein
VIPKGGRRGSKQNGVAKMQGTTASGAPGWQSSVCFISTIPEYP